jgi:HEAT repeat protein
VIAKIGPKAKDAVPAIVSCLVDHNPPDIELAQYAGRALSRVSPDDAKAQVPTLIERLHNDDPNVRSCATFALQGIDPDAKEAVPALMEALDSVSAESAARALGAIGPEAAPAVGKLIGLLAEPGRRQATIHALGRIGPPAKHAIPLLLGRLTLKSTDTATTDEQGEAAVALARIDADGSQSIHMLTAILDDQSRDEWLRCSAADALGEIVQRREEAVRALARAVSDPLAMVRAHAAVALGRSGLGSEHVVTALVGALNDPNPFVRTGAASALGRFGAAASAAVPALVEASNDPKNGRTNVKTQARVTETRFDGTQVMWEMYYKSVRGAALQALEGIGAEAARRAAENPTSVR